MEETTVKTCLNCSNIYLTNDLNSPYCGECIIKKTAKHSQGVLIIKEQENNNLKLFLEFDVKMHSRSYLKQYIFGFDEEKNNYVILNPGLKKIYSTKDFILARELYEDKCSELVYLADVKKITISSDVFLNENTKIIPFNDYKNLGVSKICKKFE